MIDRGANPFIKRTNDIDEFSYWNLVDSRLYNLPTEKSVYFTIQPFVADFQDNDDFDDPWFYQTGVFGKFYSVIGQGASGIVLKGDWFGRRAAFKFVEIENKQNLHGKALKRSIKQMTKKITEMTSIQSTKGSRIVTFYGHYR